MFRVLVAHLPYFRLERCGWEHHQPVALIAEERRAMRVVCVSPAAARQGVRVGMSASEARALAPDLQTEAATPDGELLDLESLAEQLLRVSPSVSTLPPDALVAELRGGDPQAERIVLERVRTRLRDLGHMARVVIADTAPTALACAAWGTRDRIIPVGGAAEALAPLPIDALELPNAERELLVGLGVRTIGAFAALPPASVVGRLGPTGAAAHALARGHMPALPVPARAEGPEIRASQDFPDPVIERDALLFVLNALLRDVCARLSAGGLAAVRLSLRFHLDSGGRQDLSVRLGEPCRDARQMLALLRTRLERFQLAGAVSGVTVEVPEPERFQSRQRDLLGWHSVGASLADVMARLQDQLGEGAVRVPRLVSRHRPEAEWQPTPFRAAAAATPSSPMGHALAAAAQDPVWDWEGEPDAVLPDRPPILLSPPIAIDVHAPPGRLPTSLLLDGRWVGVQRLEGLEQLAGEWWERGFAREYWRASLSDGRCAWLYREDGRWALHGWWDR